MEPKTKRRYKPDHTEHPAPPGDLPDRSDVVSASGTTGLFSVPPQNSTEYTALTHLQSLQFPPDEPPDV